MPDNPEKSLKKRSSGTGKSTGKKPAPKRSLSQDPRLIAGVILAVCAVVCLYLIIHFTPTNKKMSTQQYFGEMAEDQAAIVLGDQVLEERALEKGGSLYIPYSLVQSKLNPRFYWDTANGRMLLTTATQEFEIPINSSSYSIIDGVLPTDPVSEGSFGKTILLRPDDSMDLYVNLDYLELYTDLTYRWEKETKHVLLRNEWGEVLTASAVKEAAVRYLGGIKSPILTNVQKGDKVFVLEEMNKWTKVQTKDGFIGYVKKNRLSSPAAELVEAGKAKIEYPSLTAENPITLVWHNISTEEGSKNFSSDTSNMRGVDVISPTWFSLKDNQGNVSSIGSLDYVRSAHNVDLKVWGLISDFSSDMDTSAVLASTAARKNCISQLIDYAQALGLDGINLDFEYMEEADALAYVQFVRELSIACRRNGLVFSVDLACPYDFNNWQNRREVATVADYLINMGYDEHYKGSEAGSVASLAFEERGINECLMQGVPANKLITGIPFYTRIWYTGTADDGSSVTTSEILSMGSVRTTLESWNVTPVWRADTTQNYAEWTAKDGVLCRIWIEDASSIARKAQMVPKYSLGGVAAWVLGYETNDIWQTIVDNRNLSADGFAQAEIENAAQDAAGIVQAEETEAVTEA